MMLLIPGPVTTRDEVKQAFCRDYAPWDREFRAMHAELKSRLLALAGGDSSEHVILPLQGCGHFAVEAAIRTFLPPTGKILIPDTGDYADHMQRLALESGRQVVSFSVSDTEPLSVEAVAAVLETDPEITHVGLVQSETGIGVCHDVIAIGKKVAELGRRTIIDAISGFGALPLDISQMPEVDAVVFTANKCLEAFPGLSFIAVSIERLTQSRNNAGCWSLDLCDIYDHSRSKPAGTWRFTPVPQATAALMKALDLLEEEGGPEARLIRYNRNKECFYKGMRNIGLTPYLPEEVQGPIVVNVHAPDTTNWHLQTFVDALKKRKIIISNFYNTKQPGFRVGCIGAISPEHMSYAVEMVAESLAEFR